MQALAASFGAVMSTRLKSIVGGRRHLMLAFVLFSGLVAGTAPVSTAASYMEIVLTGFHSVGTPPLVMPEGPPVALHYSAPSGNPCGEWELLAFDAVPPTELAGGAACSVNDSLDGEDIRMFFGLVTHNPPCTITDGLLLGTIDGLIRVAGTWQTYRMVGDGAGYQVCV